MTSQAILDIIFLCAAVAFLPLILIWNLVDSEIGQYLTTLIATVFIGTAFSTLVGNNDEQKLFGFVGFIIGILAAIYITNVVHSKRRT